jgi:hypothetical protein
MNNKFTLSILVKLILKKLYFKRKVELHPNKKEYLDRLKEVESIIKSIKEINNGRNSK